MVYNEYNKIFGHKRPEKQTNSCCDPRTKQCNTQTYYKAIPKRGLSISDGQKKNSVVCLSLVSSSSFWTKFEIRNVQLFQPGSRDGKSIELLIKDEGTRHY